MTENDAIVRKKNFFSFIYKKNIYYYVLEINGTESDTS